MKRLAVSAMMAAFCLGSLPPAYRRARLLEHRAQHHPVGPVGRACRRPPTGRPSRRACTTRSRRSSTTCRTRDLTRYFKSEKLGIKGQGPLQRERVPRKGVRIFRDRFNVPHIYGKTNDDVTWGAGWAVAHDRELLLEQARYNARVAVVDAPGLSAIGLSSGSKTFKPSAQTERELRQGGRRSSSSYGKPGRRLLHDMRVFVKGINAYYKEQQAEQADKPWTRPRRDRPQRRSRASCSARAAAARSQAAQMLDGLQDSLGAGQGLLGLERPAPAPGPGDDRSRSRATSRTRRCPASRTRQRGARQRLVPARARRPDVTRLGGQRDFRAAREQRADGGRQALEVGPSAVRRRPADRLLLPGPDARDGPARPRLERARRHLRRRSPATS